MCVVFKVQHKIFLQNFHAKFSCVFNKFFMWLSFSAFSQVLYLKTVRIIRLSSMTFEPISWHRFFKIIMTWSFFYEFPSIHDVA